MRKLAVLLLFLTAGLATAADADDSSVRAEVDARKLGVEDQVQLTLTLEGAVRLSEEVALAPLTNLRRAGGPFLSTQVSMTNGSISQQRVYTWVLQPAAAGKAEIGAFSVKLVGGEKATAPISLEIVPGSIRPRAARGGSPLDPDPFGGGDPFDRLFGRARRSNPRQAAPKVFVEASADRTRLHVGEPLLLTYYIYTQTQISDVQFSDAPQFPGFWSEELARRKENSQAENTTVEGESFGRIPIAQKLLFATKAGTLEIPAVKLKLGVARQSFFDPGDQVIERETKPLTITVDAIPEEPGFSGAVGRFKATASLDKTALPLGEAATLRFRVEGRGNLKWIDKPPELQIPGAKVYPPTTKSDLQVAAAGISGSKTWEFVVVPETAGHLEIPALAFSYFDPGAARIERSETAAIPLEVQGAVAGAGSVAPALSAAAARPAGGLVLRSDIDPPSRWLPEPSARGVALGLLLVTLLHVGLWGGPRLADQLRSAQGRPAPRRNVRAALAEIQRAARDRMSKEAAAGLLEKALHDAFGPVAEASSATDGDRERAARTLLQEIQFIRYAPQLGDYSEKIRDVAARAADVVRRWA